jgi:transcriptional regulator with XRE-family HTH domain
LNAIDAPNLVDVHIGGRIRMRREALGLSHESVARIIDVTAAEIGAFETGYSRVSAACLYDIARLLDVKVAYFFEPTASGTARNLAREGGLHEASIGFRGAEHRDMDNALPR